MYTRCPDCSTAFRVTASLLQQAAGRVRCGSCSHAFNALEHLMEDPPADDAAPDAASGQDALIDTFTDLSAFDDVRIEDTGVEWRVVDDDEETGDGFLADDGAPPGSVENTAFGSPAEYPPARDDVADAADSEIGPEVRDDVSTEDPQAPASPDDGLVVEESGIYPQEPPGQRAADQAELRYDDNTPLPDELADDAAWAGDEGVPQRRATDRDEPRSPEFDERQDDLALVEPEDWRELLDEVGGEPEAAPPIGGGAFFQAETPGLDAGSPADSQGLEPPDTAAGAPDDALDFDLEQHADDDGPSSEIDFDPGRDESVDIDFAIRGDEEPGAGNVDFDPGDGERATGSHFVLADAFADGDSKDAEDDEERASREREVALEAELDAAYADDEETRSGEATEEEIEEDGHEIPPQTEEEMTINMQIDQDLMRLAEEQGFGATLTGERKIPNDSLLVETIVMEGDFVKTALDKELDAAIETAAENDDDPRALLETYIKSKDRIRGGRRRTDPPSYTAIAAVAVLGVLLAAQVVHAYRETLATYGAFDYTIGSVYRLFGEPLVPDWNVRGWRFESTNGSTDASDEVLTVHSRISNQSGQALPYPLMHIALTDRFEEIIGSRILEPSEYLVDGEDAGVPVAPNAEFSAVITVESLSTEATGFKLNVCYPKDAGHLRCATEDFRN